MFNTTIWIAEGFLAAFFLMAGLPKIVGKGIDRWVGFDDVPRLMTIIIGISEICAAVGLVLPIVAAKGEWTTPLAGLGIGVISLMASGFHIRNKEWLAALETSLWASLAGAITVARWDKISTGPSMDRDVLVPILCVLVPAVIANLVVLTIKTVPVKPTMG